MARSRRKHRQSIPRPAPVSHDKAALDLSPDLVAKKERQLCMVTIVILLLFGIYLSVIYFGHQPVPNSDFPAFTRTAKEVLSFQRPTYFKRLPGLGYG